MKIMVWRVWVANGMASLWQTQDFLDFTRQGRRRTLARRKQTAHEADSSQPTFASTPLTPFFQQGVGAAKRHLWEFLRQPASACRLFTANPLLKLLVFPGRC